MRLQAFCLSTSIAFAAGAAAEPVVLPVSLDLRNASTLVLDLERVQVDVRVDAREAPSLHIRSLPGQATEAAVEVEDGGRTVLVRRRLEDPGERQIRLEVTLRPEHALEISGRDLELALDAPPAELPADGAADDPGDPASGDGLEGRFEGLAGQYQVRLLGSTGEVSGIAGLRLEAETSAVRVRETRGAMLARLDGGSLTSEDHRGPLRVIATGAEAEVLRHTGGLLFELAGGELAVLTGDGTYRGEVADGGISLIDWTGRAAVEGRGARIEIRDGREPVEVTVAGSGLDVAVTRLDGTFAAELDGGRLTGSAVAGNVEVSARNEARVALSELRGKTAAFTLTTGASADLLDVASELDAEVTAGGRLEVDGVRQLAVKVVDAEIVADGVDAVRMVSVKNARYDLDLTRLRRQPAIAQRGSNHGRLKLAQPCVVHLAGPAEVIDEQAEVTGCELVTEASPEEKRRRGQRDYPEGTTVLVTNVEKGSGRLEIEGVVVP